MLCCVRYLVMDLMSGSLTDKVREAKGALTSSNLASIATQLVRLHVYHPPHLHAHTHARVCPLQLCTRTNTAEHRNCKQVCACSPETRTSTPQSTLQLGTCKHAHL